MLLAGDIGGTNTRLALCDDAGRRIVLRANTRVSDSTEIMWLTEACLRYLGQPINVASLESLPILYPFRFEESVAYALSRSPTLELRTDGANQAMVTLGKLEPSVSEANCSTRRAG